MNIKYKIIKTNFLNYKYFKYISIQRIFIKKIQQYKNIHQNNGLSLPKETIVRKVVNYSKKHAGQFMTIVRPINVISLFQRRASFIHPV